MIDDLRTGLRRSAGLAASTFVLGVTFGALARADGWGLGAPAVAAMAIFSSSAQFALLTTLAGGGAAWTAVASAALINLRFFPMGLSVAPALRANRGARRRRHHRGAALGAARRPRTARRCRGRAPRSPKRQARARMTIWICVALTALVSFAIKRIGPAILGN